MIAVLNLDMENFRRSRCVQTSKGGHLVADDQEQLHPQRMMRENAEEDIDDTKLPATQRHPVGVTKIRVFDEVHHNLRAASALAISFRMPYRWNGTTNNR